jgi:polyisoprenoid-binding protein YceI
LLLCVTAALPAQTTTLPLDPHSSSLKWTGHAEVGTYAPSGTLAIRDGRVDIAGGKFAAATMTIDMNSLQQANSDLVHHLKSPDFFDVEHFPTSTLTLNKLSGGKVAGTLTVRGKTGAIEAPVQIVQADGRFTITGKVRLDRTQYGIVYNSSSIFSGLGDKAISNYFEVEFTISGAGTLPAQVRS